MQLRAVRSILDRIYSYSFPGAKVSVSRDSIVRVESLSPVGKAWTFLPPSLSSSSSSASIALRAVEVSANFTPSVVGVNVNDSYLLTLLKDHTNGAQLSCNEADLTQCYLLDEGGFVVYTNQVK